MPAEGLNLLAFAGEKVHSKRGDCGWRRTVIFCEDKVIIVSDFDYLEEKAVVVKSDGKVYTVRGGKVWEFGEISPEFYRKYREYLESLSDYIRNNKSSSEMVHKIYHPLEEAMGKWIVYP